MARKKIESLTEAQRARFPEFINKWTQIGLSTNPADRPRAEAAIRAAYAAAGKAPPKKIVWCGSPLSQGLTRAIILDKGFAKQIGEQVWASVRDSVEDSVWASVGDSVRASVWDSVRASVGASVRDSVWVSVRASVWDSVGASVGASVRDSVRASVEDSVWASVGDSVWDSVWVSVRASVGASVWASVGASVRDSVRASVGDSVRDSGYGQRDSGYGQHDANWIGFYDFFRTVCNLRAETDKLEGLRELTESAGWYLPHEHICWVSERHSLLSRDERGRLHSLSGPAVAYPDGWGVYAVHGVRVPADIIERPQDLTAARVRNEANAEVRRVMMQIFGFDRYVAEIGAKLVSTDQVGKLWRVEDEAPFHLAEVINSTKEPDGSLKTYFLPVPDISDLTGRRIESCHEAIAWTFSMHKSEYRPQVET